MNVKVITVSQSLDMDDLAKEIGMQLVDGDVLSFLAKLNHEMRSWDFTQKAADLFVRTAAQLNVGLDGHNPSDQAVIARVTEFARQSKLNPSVERTDVITGTWTDPAAEHTQLTLSDLRSLIELATVGYVSMIEARSNPR